MTVHFLTITLLAEYVYLFTFERNGTLFSLAFSISSISLITKIRFIKVWNELSSLSGLYDGIYRIDYAND